jgi:hypothetical protein
VNVTQWHGCYSGSWQGILVPDAFAHPAKVAPGLSYRIYRYMIDAGYIAPGDSVFDPFGGIGGFGYHAMLLGLHWTGVELEPRFVELGQRNIDKWRRDLAMLNGTLGTARLLQGDSRRLLEVVGGGMAASICSPPFETTEPVRDDNFRFNGQPLGATGDHYGDTPGQLGSMRSGDYAAAVSSPPYADNAATWVEGPGARHDPIHHNGDNAHKISSDNGYGSTPGNVGNMRDGGFEGVVSSPPYESSVNDPRNGGGIDLAKFKNPNKHAPRAASIGANTVAAFEYGSDPANIGNDTGDTFWAAARAIVEQTYAALRPGGYAAWVCKDFVRKGQRVPFSDQWQALCAAVGFVPVERIAAMLVDDHGDQLDIFGGVTARRKERKSFFRRLAEKKGSPRIDHEDVIIMRKPVTE